jgi:hypothetical protein
MWEVKEILKEYDKSDDDKLTVLEYADFYYSKFDSDDQCTKKVIEAGVIKVSIFKYSKFIIIAFVIFFQNLFYFPHWILFVQFFLISFSV